MGGHKGIPGTIGSGSFCVSWLGIGRCVEKWVMSSDVSLVCVSWVLVCHDGTFGNPGHRDKCIFWCVIVCHGFWRDNICVLLGHGSILVMGVKMCFATYADFLP